VLIDININKQRERGTNLVKRILFIDSELTVLNTLQQSFWDKNYQVLTACSGTQALEIMDATPVDLVVSELRMPDMDGGKLLQMIKSRYPATLRVILSGCVDDRLVVQSLMDNMAKIYLYKPWDNRMLLSMIDNLFETDVALENKEILAVIKSTEKLPTLNTSFRRIIRLLDSDPSFEKVAREIEKDQAVSSKLLHLANSAFYGLKTGSISQAVKYLGFNTIRNLVISMPIMDCLSAAGPDGEIIEKQWNHAFVTNSILIFLYERFLSRRLGEVEGTAGLLHNIGVSFLIKQYRKPYMQLLIPDEDNPRDLVADEKALLGAAHPEIGGFLLRWWDLPYPIVESAIYHHDPFDPHVINKTLVQAVHISQHYALRQLNEPPCMPLSADAFAALGISQERFEQEMNSRRVLF
jgi:HD-like signal output (HDOD) protein